MHRVFTLAVLLTLVPFGTIPPTFADDPPAWDDPDATLLKRKGVADTPAGLTTALAAAAGPDVASDDVTAAVRDLASPRYAVREAAAAKLLGYGPPALAALRRAGAGTDAEVAKRCRDLAERIAEKHPLDVAGACARRLIRRGDPAAVDAVLKFLPFAHDADLEADLWYGLDGLAAKGPAGAARLAGAAKDPSPARRALAGHFAARYGGEPGRAAAAGLLSDADPVVRLRAAQGLVAAHDGRGVPALIELLADTEPAVRWEAADLLRWVADPGPAVPEAGATTADWTASRAAWTTWWATARATLDWKKLSDRPARPGLCLIVDRADRRMSVVGADGTPYWTLSVGPDLVEARPGRGGVVVLRTTGKEESQIGVFDWRGEQVFSRTHEVDLRSVAPRPDGTWLALRAASWPITNPRTYLVSFSRAGDLTGHVQVPVPVETLEAVRALPDGRVLLGSGPDFKGPTGKIGRLVVLDTADNYFRNAPPPDLSGFEPVVEVTPSGELVALRKTDGATGTTVVHAFLARRLSTVTFEVPNARHASGTRGGLLVVARPWRVAAYTRDGRCVAEVPYGGSPDQVHEVFPLARLGFGPGPTAKVADTGAYRATRVGSGSPRERMMTLRVLKDMGTDGIGTVNALKAVLAATDPEMRKLAEQIIATIAEGEKRLRELMATADLAGDAEAREKLFSDIYTYKTSGAVVPYLIGKLQHPDAKVRNRAAAYLGAVHIKNGRWVSNHLDQADLIVPALIEVIDDSDRDVRWMAIQSASMFGPKAVGAVPSFARAAQGSDHTAVAHAISAIGRTDLPVSDDVYQFLLRQVLQGPTRHIQGEAITSITRTRGNHKDLAPVIKRVFLELPNDEASRYAKAACLHGLGRIAREDEAVVQFLIEQLEDVSLHTDIRMAAVAGISLAGDKAILARPVLQRLLSSSTEEQRFLDAVRSRLDELDRTVTNK